MGAQHFIQSLSFCSWPGCRKMSHINVGCVPAAPAEFSVQNSHLVLSKQQLGTTRNPPNAVCQLQGFCVIHTALGRGVRASLSPVPAQNTKPLPQCQASSSALPAGGAQGWWHCVGDTGVLCPQRYLLMQAKPGPWEFHSDVLTSQSPQEICDNIIREKLLEYLPLEVPYGVTQVGMCPGRLSHELFYWEFRAV